MSEIKKRKIDLSSKEQELHIRIPSLNKKIYMYPDYCQLFELYLKNFNLLKLNNNPIINIKLPQMQGIINLIKIKILDEQEERDQFFKNVSEIYYQRKIPDNFNYKLFNKIENVIIEIQDTYYKALKENNIY